MGVQMQMLIYGRPLHFKNAKSGLDIIGPNTVYFN